MIWAIAGIALGAVALALWRLTKPKPRVVCRYEVDYVAEESREADLDTLDTLLPDGLQIEFWRLRRRER